MYTLEQCLEQQKKVDASHYAQRGIYAVNGLVKVKRLNKLKSELALN